MEIKKAKEELAKNCYVTVGRQLIMVGVSMFFLTRSLLKMGESVGIYAYGMQVLNACDEVKRKEKANA